MFIGPCIIVIVEEWKTKLISLAILFHFLCAQHVSDINISIIRSLLLFCWITALVLLILVRCVLEFRCGWVGVVSVLQAEVCNTDNTPTETHQISKTHRTKKNTTNVVIQQNSSKLLVMDVLMSETCWAHKNWNKIASEIILSFFLQHYRKFTWNYFKSIFLFTLNRNSIFFYYILVQIICKRVQEDQYDWNRFVSCN